MKNTELFQRAQQRIPAGVNSPVRAFRAVGGTPPFLERACGAHVWDVEGKRYIDYLGSWGPMVAGHTHPAVVEAVQEAASRALSFGAPTAAEVELAELLARLVPSLELVRLVSSGTEATMTALRLARGFTGRDLVVKFEGCYHGHADALLVKAGSGALTFGNPSSAGVPADTAAHTLVLDYNDASRVRALFKRTRRRDRRRDRRAGGRQHEPRAAEAGIPRSAARGMHAPRRGADPRRGDDRLPRRRSAARRRASASGPTSPRSAR